MLNLIHAIQPDLKSMLLLYNIFLVLVFSLAVVVFFLLFFITAPYGKFLRKGWGLTIRSKWAWMIMESPSPLLISILFLISPAGSLPQVIFVCFWLTHYLHRSYIYPFVHSGKNKDYPFLLVIMAFIFNITNGYINGYEDFILRSYKAEWFLSWQFIAGTIVFIIGFLINKIADAKLRSLRNDNPSEYVIPQGWLFNYISCPHYLGEIIEWTGWAILTWSVSGVAFAVFTFANLFPRAVTSHNWYRTQFPCYPAERKAVIPFLI